MDIQLTYSQDRKNSPAIGLYNEYFQVERETWIK
jgi:hypothetical protein